MGTKEAIKQNFIKLYAKLGYQKMNVRQLCQAVPVARTTFYSYYQNLDEVLLEIEDELIAGIIAINRQNYKQYPKKEDFMKLFDQIYPYLMQNIEVIKVLLIDDPDYRLITKWKKAIKEHLEFAFPKQAQRPNWPLLSEMFASALISAYIFMIEHDQAYSIEVLKSQIYAFIKTIAKT